MDIRALLPDRAQCSFFNLSEIVRVVNEGAPLLIILNNVHNKPYHHSPHCTRYKCQVRLCALLLESSKRKKNPCESPLAKTVV